MKHIRLAIYGLAVVVATSSQGALITVGTGADSSYLIVESPNIGLREYKVFFDYNPSRAIGTADLIRIADLGDDEIEFTLLGTTNQFLSAVTFNGVSELYDGTNYWNQWVASGEAGAGPGPDYSPDPRPIPSDSWTYGSGVSAPYRIVVPGASDALVFNNGATRPSTRPVPEPTSLFLALLGSSFVFLRRRA